MRIAPGERAGLTARSANMVCTATSIAERGDFDVDQQRVSQERKSINFRVHTLASSLFKGATQYYGVHFGVGLPEMRVLSNLGSEGPLAAHQIVALTAMDKALVSRVLTTLGRRRYVTASSPKTDPRRRTWELTRAGRDLVRQLRPEWKRREAIIQAELSEIELSLLADMLERMLVASEKLRAEEMAGLRSVRKSQSKSRVRPRLAHEGTIRPAQAS
jgi:DNA-binding MarR family transcriptional regulator